MSSATIDLQSLTPESAQELGKTLVQLAAGASHRRRVAERIVNHLYDNTLTSTGERACVLARCFQTCSYAQLPLHYQDAADKLLESLAPQPDMRCLTLLATRGTRITWNDPTTSIGHQAIPLPSVEVVRRAPMIARLLAEMGIPIEQIVTPPSSPDFILGETLRSLNVFHIPEALGSPFIPAQATFVEPYGVRSVIGMGGMFPDGNLFAILLFTRIPIPRETAPVFQILAASVSQILTPFSPMNIFIKTGNR